MPEPLLTAREVSVMLGMSPRWVLQEWQAGRLPGFKLGVAKRGPVRFRESDIESWLQSHKRGAA